MDPLTESILVPSRKVTLPQSVVHPVVLQREHAATCVWHTRSIEIWTYEHACRIPQSDKLGKEQAFRTTQTDPKQLQWWLFAANLGPHTERVIGSVLISSSLL